MAGPDVLWLGLCMCLCVMCLWLGLMSLSLGQLVTVLCWGVHKP